MNRNHDNLVGHISIRIIFVKLLCKMYHMSIDNSMVNQHLIKKQITPVYNHTDDFLMQTLKSTGHNLTYSLFLQG